MNKNEKREFTIDVTQADIVRGLRISCRECPVALAAKRATGCKRVGTDGSEIVLKFPGKRALWAAILPREVCLWIERFDGREKVSPIQFNLAFERAPQWASAYLLNQR